MDYPPKNISKKSGQWEYENPLNQNVFEGQKQDLLFPEKEDLSLCPTVKHIQAHSNSRFRR
jgi:hypothetical protein